MTPEHEDLVKEIIYSNQMLRLQLWIVAGMVTSLLVVIGFFMKGAWNDMKTMLENHDVRLMIVEKNIAVIDNQVQNL